MKTRSLILLPDYGHVRQGAASKVFVASEQAWNTHDSNDCWFLCRIDGVLFQLLRPFVDGKYPVYFHTIHADSCTCETPEG